MISLFIKHYECNWDLWLCGAIWQNFVFSDMYNQFRDTHLILSLLSCCWVFQLMKKKGKDFNLLSRLWLSLTTANFAVLFLLRRFKTYLFTQPRTRLYLVFFKVCSNQLSIHWHSSPKKFFTGLGSIVSYCI